MTALSSTFRHFMRADYTLHSLFSIKQCFVGPAGDDGMWGDDAISGV